MRHFVEPVDRRTRSRQWWRRKQQEKGWIDSISTPRLRRGEREFALSRMATQPVYSPVFRTDRRRSPIPSRRPGPRLRGRGTTRLPMHPGRSACTAPSRMAESDSAVSTRLACRIADRQRCAVVSWVQASARSSTHATCSASRPAPSRIWWRQLKPSVTTSAAGGAARTAGSSVSSPIAIDTS
jgi:hypothetical protein